MQKLRNRRRCLKTILGICPGIIFNPRAWSEKPRAAAAMEKVGYKSSLVVAFNPSTLKKVKKVSWAQLEGAGFNICCLCRAWLARFGRADGRPDDWQSDYCISWLACWSPSKDSVLVSALAVYRVSAEPIMKQHLKACGLSVMIHVYICHLWHETWNNCFRFITWHFILGLCLIYHLTLAICHNKSFMFCSWYLRLDIIHD